MMPDIVSPTCSGAYFIPFTETIKSISLLKEACQEFAYRPSEFDFVDTAAVKALGILNSLPPSPGNACDLDIPSFEHLTLIHLCRPDINRCASAILKLREDLGLRELSGNYTEVMAGAAEVRARIYADDATTYLVEAIARRRHHERATAHATVCQGVGDKAKKAHRLAFKYAIHVLSARFSEQGEWHDYAKTSNPLGCHTLHQLVQRKDMRSPVGMAYYWYKEHYDEIMQGLL